MNDNFLSVPRGVLKPARKNEKKRKKKKNTLAGLRWCLGGLGEPRFAGGRGSKGSVQQLGGRGPMISK